jgi:16S rRNA C1402 (ribose-2'-O) methylase RsmI
MQGKLYLVPSTLGSESTKHVIPSDVIEIVKPIRYFAVEEIKSARRLLRKMDREFPIDESQTCGVVQKHERRGPEGVEVLSANPGIRRSEGRIVRQCADRFQGVLPT